MEVAEERGVRIMAVYIDKEGSKIKCYGRKRFRHQGLVRHTRPLPVSECPARARVAAEWASNGTQVWAGSSVGLLVPVCPVWARPGGRRGGRMGAEVIRPLLMPACPARSVERVRALWDTVPLGSTVPPRGGIVAGSPICLYQCFRPGEQHGGSHGESSAVVAAPMGPKAGDDDTDSPKAVWVPGPKT